MQRFALRCQSFWQQTAYISASIPHLKNPLLNSTSRTFTMDNIAQTRQASSFGASSASPPSATPDEIFSKHYRNITLPDGPIRVYEYGPQNTGSTSTRPPILLLHGAMLDTSPFIWRDLLSSLSSTHRVLAIDFPRHGGSRPWPDTSYLDQLALESILTSVLDTLSLNRITLIGLSMGGGLATGYAINNPSRVSALVAINPGGLDDTRPAQFPTYLMTRCGPLLRWTTRYLATRPNLLRYSNKQNLVAGEQTRDFDALMALAEKEASESARHGEAALDDWQIDAYGPWKMKLNFWPKVETLEVPSLWVHGQKDNLIMEKSMKSAAERAPRGKFVNIPDAGHFAPLDQPERVHNAIVQFLEEVEG